MNVKQVKQIVQSKADVTAGDTYFLVSNRGYYYIQLIIEKGKTLPSYFCCYDMHGQEVYDVDFITQVSNKIELLKELSYYNDEKKNIVEEDSESSYLGVIHGEGWFDYQFPANPDKFVGRSTMIEIFHSTLESVQAGDTNTKVVEILSRSGVGKSSIALKLQHIYHARKCPTAIVDSRNIRTDIDILQIFQILVNDFNMQYELQLEIPKRREEISVVGKMMDEINVQNNRMAVIFLDQFESVFVRPSIYNAVIDIILEFNVKYKSFIFVIARKNDQPTTYDESAEIDLNRLKSISKPIVLQDFKTEEAIELISHINDEIGASLIKPLKEQVLEISNGFPWLLKKYCAHIIRLVKSGVKQKTIVQTGMQLEDLFNEDILALDETIRDFFYRLIAFLPATYSELSEVFADEDLSIKLRILQNDYRLIRLTGRTYDTYNDILKEFVKTGHINLSKRYLIRYTPNVVLNMYQLIVNNDLHSIEQIEANTQTKKGSIVNILSELKKLRFIEGDNSNFSFNSYAYQRFKEKNIVKHLANVLLENTLVKIIVNEVEKKKTLSMFEVKKILIKEMPFIEATDKIWEQYSNIMCKWIATAGLVKVSKDKVIISSNSQDGIEDFFNEELFFPTTMLSQIIKVVELLSENRKGMTIQNLKTAMNRTSLNGHLVDAYYLGFVKSISRSEYEITDKGIGFLEMNPEERRTYIREKLLELPHVEYYLEAVKKNKQEPIETFTRMLQDMKVDKWNEVSIKWKHKILRNWLIYARLVVGKTHKNKEK